MKTANVAVFASGSGTNAEALIKYFKNHPDIGVSILLTNNPNAPVLTRAANLKVPSHIFTRNEFYQSRELLAVLDQWDVNAIVLAGFLWLIPEYLINRYPDRIINIHPAILPKFGGKGMYGMNVHKAVLDSGQTESGITIHLVNSEYDKGRIIFQKRLSIDEHETPETLANKIHLLEHQHYPQVVEEWLLVN